MERKIFKWTAGLAVALTLAGGAAGLSPAPLHLPDYSVTAAAASNYSFDSSSCKLTLKGSFTFDPNELPKACNGGSEVTGLYVADGADVTFEDDLEEYFPNLTRAVFWTATVRNTDENGWFFADLKSLDCVILRNTQFEGCWTRAFYGCENLESVELSLRPGQTINEANFMFQGCKSLKEIDLSVADLSGVRKMNSMFEGCTALQSVNLTTLDASKINFNDYRDYQKMFMGADNLTELKLPANFVLKSRMGITQTGAGCPEGMEGWAFSDDVFTCVSRSVSVPDMATGVDYADYNTATPTEPVTLLRRSAWLKKGSCYLEDAYNYVLNVFGNVNRAEIYNLDDGEKITKINFAEGTVFPKDCSSLFSHFQKLPEIDLTNVDTSNVTTMKKMFLSCTSLKSIKARGNDTSQVTTMEGMFENCQSLESFRFKDYGYGSQMWDTKNVTTFERMFAGCTSLQIMDADFETDKITSVKQMFQDCPQLHEVRLHDFNLLNVAAGNKADMFANCPSLTSLSLSYNFGTITQNMKLRNDNGGWCDEYGNGIPISGNAQYAVIDTSTTPFLVHASKITTVGMNRTFKISQNPVPGYVAPDDLVTIESSEIAIVKSESGWFDAHTGKKLVYQPFEPNSAYYLKIRLRPTAYHRFGAFTAEDFDKIKFQFFVNASYNSNKQFVDLRAANLTEDGYLDLYAVVDSGSGNTPIVQKSYIKKIELPEGTVQRYSDSYANQNILPCYYMFNVTFPTTPFSLTVSADFFSSAYRNYVGSNVKYECSLDGGDYQLLDSQRVVVGPGLLPGTQHNIKIRFKNSNHTLVEKNVTTNAPNTPVAGGDIVGFGCNHFNTKFSAHTVALNNNLGCVYYVPAADLEGYENIKLLIQKEIFDGSGNVSYTMEEVRDYSIQDGGYGDEYIFEYKKIAAKEMASHVFATVYAEKNGNVYINKIDSYCVVDYALKKLNSQSTKLVLAKLCVDMLNYGAAAQTHFSYNTANLANSTMTAAHQALATNPNTLQLKSDTKVVPLNGTAKAYFSGKTLELGNNISLVFLMQFDDDVDKNNVSLKLSYKTITGQSVSDTIPFSEFEKCEKLYQGKPEYRYSYNRVRAKDAAQPVTATILINGSPASDTLTYSVQSYAKAKLDNSATSADLKTIIKALMVYCKSAEAYFKS